MSDFQDYNLPHEKEFLDAAITANIAVLAELLEEHGSELLEVRGVEGDTPISLAALNGHLDVVKFLVEQGASIDHDYDSGSALYEAASGAKTTVVEYLLEQGAEVDVACVFGTPLMGAISRRDRESVRLLLNHGARVFKDDGDGLNVLADEDERDALEMAREADDAVILRELFDRGLIPIDASGSVLDWVLREPDVDVPNMVRECLGDAKLSGALTPERIQSYIARCESEAVLTLLRSELVSRSLNAEIGDGDSAPAPRRSMAGMGL